MFSTPVLDVGIALFMVYFLLAIIVSALNEIIMSVLDMRAKMLKATILHLIEDEKWKDLAGEIIKSPLISSLKKKEDLFPSYIPAGTFVEALKYAADTKNLFRVSNEVIIQYSREESKNNSTLKMFEIFAESAQKNVLVFEKKIESLFNGAMDRLNGWYKRKVQNILFFISVAVVLILNVDTVNIIKTLWNNSILAKTTADQISLMVQSSDENTFASLADTTRGRTEVIKDAYAILENLPFPIGWKKENLITEDIFGWAAKFFGLLVTAFAATLGAPFWFDLLNKAVNLRSTGKKPGEKKENSA